MHSSKLQRIVINAGIDYKLPVPYVAMGNGTDKDETVFIMADREKLLSIVGTFDEIVSFASSMIAAMYSWPIMAGREEWLGDQVVPDTEGAEVYVIHRNNPQGNHEDRGSGDQNGGNPGDVA